MSTATPRKFARSAVDPGKDADMCALPEGPQLLYTLILREPLLSKVGTFDIKTKRWAKWVHGWTPETVTDYLNTLVANRFIFLDDENDIGLIRSYVRHDDSLRNWRHAQGVLAALKGVHSDEFRHAIAAELARVDPAAVCVTNTEAPAPVAEKTRREIFQWVAEWLVTDFQSFANTLDAPLAKDQTKNYKLQTSTLKEDVAASRPTSAPEASDEVKVLADGIAHFIGLGLGEKPKVTKTFLNDVRLLVTADKRDPGEVKAVARFLGSPACWHRGKVESARAFRSKYLILRAAMTETTGTRAVATTSVPVDDTDQGDLAAFGGAA